MSAKTLLGGLKWTSAATLVNFVAQFFFLGVMARLLNPEAFGLMAMCAIVLRFASFFAQMGAGQALIQKSSLTPRDVGAALILALGISSALYILLWLLAPLASLYFRSEQLVDLVRWMGVNLVLTALSGIPLAFLRREGRFAMLSVVEVVSYVIGYGAVGALCAYQGLGVWSLVIAAISQAGLACMLGFALAKVTWEFAGARKSLGHFWRFGSRHSLVGFLEFIGSSVETIYIGRYVGQHQLGIYNRGQLITSLPVEQSVGAFGKVMFPALAKMQDDRARLGEAFLGMLLAIGLLASAVSFGISAAAEDIVAVLLGPKWSETIVVVQLLAFSVPALFFYFVCGITLDSIAALNKKLRIQTVSVVLKIGLVLAFASQGLAGIIMAVIVAEYVRALLGLWQCQRELILPGAKMAGAIGFSLFTGVMVYAAVHFSHAGMQELQAGLWLRLFGQVFAGLISLVIVLLLAMRLLPQNSSWRRSAILVKPLALLSKRFMFHGA